MLTCEFGQQINHIYNLLPIVTTDVNTIVLFILLIQQGGELLVVSIRSRLKWDNDDDEKFVKNINLKHKKIQPFDKDDDKFHS